jgi:hypothetical protein
MGHLATLSPAPSIEEMFDCPKKSLDFIRDPKYQAITAKDSELYSTYEAQSPVDVVRKWQDMMPPHLGLDQQRSTDTLAVSVCP